MKYFHARENIVVDFLARYIFLPNIHVSEYILGEYVLPNTFPEPILDNIFAVGQPYVWLSIFIIPMGFLWIPMNFFWVSIDPVWTSTCTSKVHAIPRQRTDEIQAKFGPSDFDVLAEIWQVLTSSYYWGNGRSSAANSLRPH